MLQLSRDAVLVCAVGGLRAASVSLAGVLIAIHLSSRGFSTSAIGLVIGVGMTASAVGTVVTGLYADTWGRRRTLALLGVVTALGYLALPFLDTLPALLISRRHRVNGMDAIRARLPRWSRRCSHRRRLMPDIK
jgi:MFS family permease